MRGAEAEAAEAEKGMASLLLRHLPLVGPKQQWAGREVWEMQNRGEHRAGMELRAARYITGPRQDRVLTAERNSICLRFSVRIIRVGGCKEHLVLS